MTEKEKNIEDFQKKLQKFLKETGLFRSDYWKGFHDGVKELKEFIEK